MNNRLHDGLAAKGLLLCSRDRRVGPGSGPLKFHAIWKIYTLNANMADHLVGARDESHESEASWTLMFCFDNVSPEKACFVANLVCFISLWL